jgi:zinc transport system permease protein
VDLNIEGLFFGDILFVSSSEVVALLILTAAVCFLVYRNFNTIIILALNEEIAISYGIKISRLRFAVLLTSALSISLIIKIVGGLTITSMSILPVFFAKIISKTPKQMILVSIVFSLILSLVGLNLAFALDLSVAATTTVLQIFVLLLTFGMKKYIL